jgi:hypothetical protein
MKKEESNCQTKKIKDTKTNWRTDRRSQYYWNWNKSIGAVGRGDEVVSEAEDSSGTCRNGNVPVEAATKQRLIKTEKNLGVL